MQEAHLKRTTHSEPAPSARHPTEALHSPLQQSAIQSSAGSPNPHQKSGDKQSHSARDSPAPKQPASLAALQSALGIWSSDIGLTHSLEHRNSHPHDNKKKASDTHTEHRSFAWKVKSSVGKTAKKTTTVRTHPMGLVRGALKPEEKFIGNLAAKGWVFGRSVKDGLPGWVKVTSLERGDRVNGNPAGKPRSIGRPHDYINGRDRNHSVLHGKKFHYTTPCKPKSHPIPLFLDIRFGQKLTYGDLPEDKKQVVSVTPLAPSMPINITKEILAHKDFKGEIKVRYYNGTRVGIMAFNLWLFCDAKYINLEQLNVRLNDDDGERAPKKTQR